MSDDSLGVVTISAREIYDEIVGMRAEVQTLVNTNTAVKETLDDHEQRIRAGERWRYAVPTAALGALISAGITIAKAVGG
ncbi:hypothetical protein ACQEV9_15595 [Streptomyces chartreusis]|uniref:hypothetical protein n=1 Tax=Streptomyces chartreusis TaxID=1969 RepID=UPI003D9333B3